MQSDSIDAAGRMESGEDAPAATATTAPPPAETDLRRAVELPVQGEALSSPAEAPAGTDALKPAPVADPSKPAVAPRGKASDQPVKRSGQVAVFVSRKERRIFVRQGFIPLFDMPVSIDEPDQPLGTHVLTAMGPAEGETGMRWNLITVPNDTSPRVERMQLRRGSARQPPAPPPNPVRLKPPSSAAQALDRIAFPPEAVERVAELLIPGSSLVISDDGLGRETGRYTEFIVLTR
jgi:hypothetical protein